MYSHVSVGSKALGDYLKIPYLEMLAAGYFLFTLASGGNNQRQSERNKLIPNTFSDELIFEIPTSSL